MRQTMLLLTMLMGLTSCGRPERVISNTAYTKKDWWSLTLVEARVMEALTKIDAEVLSKDAAEKIKANKGSPCRRSHEGLGTAGRYRSGGLFEDEEVKDALLDTDEVAAADLIYKRGVRTVIVHRALAECRCKALVSRSTDSPRLLIRFQLVRVTETALVCRVRKAPVVFPQGCSESMMRAIRERLKGQPPVAVPDLKSETGNWTFVATLRGQGRERPSPSLRTKSAKAMEELVVDLERRHRRRVGTTASTLEGPHRRLTSRSACD